MDVTLYSSLLPLPHPAGTDRKTGHRAGETREKREPTLNLRQRDLPVIEHAELRIGCAGIADNFWRLERP